MQLSLFFPHIAVYGRQNYSSEQIWLAFYLLVDLFITVMPKKILLGRCLYGLSAKSLCSALFDPVLWCVCCSTFSFLCPFFFSLCLLCFEAAQTVN